MEHRIELGAIADMSGNISTNGQLIIDGIPQIAKNIKLELDEEKSRIEKHTNYRRGGLRYVRYVAVAPAGVNEDEWLAKAKKLETLLKGFL